jgi:hypothetical protein
VSMHRFTAIWYKAAGNEPLSIVIVQDPGGNYPDTVFFDTDTAASDEDTIQRFSHRWSIEITIMNTLFYCKEVHLEFYEFMLKSGEALTFENP